MTIEQAIKSLENIVEYWSCKPTEQQAAELAITALREKQAREKGCFWCMSGTVLSDVKINGAAVYISCCPMCGRKLGENNG